jgi:hypothetical protein
MKDARREDARMAAATTPNPFLVLARILGVLMLIPIGLVAAILLVVAGVETVYFFHNRPVDAASLSTKAGVDLTPDVGSLTALEGVLGPPTGQVRSPEAENAINYWWWHDDAVRATTVGDGVVSLDFGPGKQFHLLPYRRPVFPGALLGLRIGQPPPSPADAAALQAKAKDCCDGDVTWDVGNGRMVEIHFRNTNYYDRYVGH